MAFTVTKDLIRHSCDYQDATRITWMRFGEGESKGAEGNRYKRNQKRGEEERETEGQHKQEATERVMDLWQELVCRYQDSALT